MATTREDVNKNSPFVDVPRPEAFRKRPGITEHPSLLGGFRTKGREEARSRIEVWGSNGEEGDWTSRLALALGSG